MFMTFPFFFDRPCATEIPGGRIVPWRIGGANIPVR
jgi:hypothetical protein